MHCHVTLWAQSEAESELAFKFSRYQAFIKGSLKKLGGA